MPINRIVPTARGRAAVAGVALAAAAGAGGVWVSLPQPTPAAVKLAVDHLIKPWEGLELTAYPDPATGGVPWTICWGETEGVKPGMKKTRAECERLLLARVTKDYYRPLTKCIEGFTNAPVSVQAAAISGAYNFGVGGMCGSRAATLIAGGQYRAACEAQTAWNKANGKVMTGLVRRREMGDAQRIGEAELCVSGL